MVDKPLDSAKEPEENQNTGICGWCGEISAKNTTTTFNNFFNNQSRSNQMAG
jgi:hypothetical protein